MNIKDWIETILVCYSIASVVVVPAIFYMVRLVYTIKQSIQYHLNNNGGKSLLDKIDKIYNKIELQDARWHINIDYSDRCIYECDKEGNCIFANVALCKLFGLSENEMMGAGWLSVVQDDRSEIWEKWLSDIKENIPYENVYTVKNKITKESFKVKTQAIPLKNRKGDILGYLGTVEKI